MKDSGVNAIESLMERQGNFDYILLETTGLADPGNIAPLFWVDEGLGSSIYLDGIVTLVDAKNILRCLDEPLSDETVGAQHEGEAEQDGHASRGPVLSTAHLQISHADVVVLNKADLVSPSALQTVQARVRSINALAKIVITDHSAVPALEGLVLDLHAYDHVSADSLDFESKGHSHLDPAIGTLSLTLPVLEGEEGLVRLDGWLRSVLWESRLPPSQVSDGDALPQFPGWEIHRVKGRIGMRDGSVKMLQGVREVFEIIDGAAVQSGSEDAGRSTMGNEGGKIVVIGRRLGGGGMGEAFQRSLDGALIT